MEFEENTSVETQEVAEPVTETETSAENQEVAEPDHTKTAADAAFAEMRRRAEEAEKRAAQMEAENNARAEAIKRLTNRDDAVENALAESLGIDVEDVIATLDAQTESARKDLQIEALENELLEVKVDKQMQADLEVIQAIDPSVKSLADLGDTFANLITAGVEAKDAYYAAKGRQIVETKTPPKPIGKVGNAVPEKEYFTEAEVDAMSEAEQRANYDKILKSMSTW